MKSERPPPESKGIGMIKQVKELEAALEVANNKANSWANSYEITNARWCEVSAQLAAHRQALEDAKVALEDERDSIFISGRHHVEQRRMGIISSALTTINAVLKLKEDK